MTVKEADNIMTKRGYTLMAESAGDKHKILHYADVNLDDPARLNVTVFPDKDEFLLYTIVNPGVITISTPKAGSLGDDKHFLKFETFIKDVIKKLNK